MAEPTFTYRGKDLAPRIAEAIERMEEELSQARATLASLPLPVRVAVDAPASLTTVVPADVRAGKELARRVASLESEIRDSHLWRYETLRQPKRVWELDIAQLRRLITEDRARGRR